MKLLPTNPIRAAILAATLGLAGLPAWSETLTDALISAYRNSHLLEQNRAVLRAADEDVATAIASLRPVVQWLMSTSLVDEAPIDQMMTTITLQAQVTLMDFGRGKYSTDIAKETVLATREALVSVEQNVLLSAVQAYFAVRSAEEYVTINQNSVRVVGEFLRNTQDQFDVGEVTRTDVAQAESRLAMTRATLAAAEGDLAAARESFKAATGHYPQDLAPAPRHPSLPTTTDEARRIAQRSQPLLLQAQHQVTASDLQVSLAAAQKLPTIVGQAQVSRANPSSRNNTSIGLEVNQTIYSGGGRSALHRKAVAGADSARSSLLQSSVIVDQNVGNAWAQMEVAQAQITATRQQIEAAQIAYDGVREEASLGARTTLDVLNAEQELLNAQASRITAEADYQVAIYSLLSSMGLLTVDHLQLGIPTYDPAAYYNAVKDAPSTSTQGRSLDKVLKALGRD